MERLKPLEAPSAAAKSPVAREPPNIDTQVGFSTDLGSFITKNPKQETTPPVSLLPLLLFNHSEKKP